MATKEEAQNKPQAEDAEEAEKPVPGKRRFSTKLMVVGAAAVVGLGAIGGGGYYFIAGHSEASAAPAARVKPPVFFDMPDILVNLSSNGSSDRTQYLKVEVVLELPNEAMKAQIQPLMPRVMDMFQTYLRELRATDLDGSAGLYRLKEELTRRVNAAIAPDHINAVLFKEIVVQ